MQVQRVPGEQVGPAVGRRVAIEHVVVRVARCMNHFNITRMDFVRGRAEVHVRTRRFS